MKLNTVLHFDITVYIIFSSIIYNYYSSIPLFFVVILFQSSSTTEGGADISSSGQSEPALISSTANGPAVLHSFSVLPQPQANESVLLSFKLNLNKVKCKSL